MAPTSTNSSQAKDTSGIRHIPLVSSVLQPIIDAALREDLAQGDITTDLLPEMDVPGTATINTRQDCVISGVDVVTIVLRTVDPSLNVTTHHPNGAFVQAGTVLLTVTGSLASIVRAERTALNFMQHLSGIATLTRAYVDAIKAEAPDSVSQVTDTRKTTPGLRVLEKRAVVDGGASPHRFNLGSSVMLKDNHIQAMGGIIPAVRAVQSRIGHTTKIEVETESLADVRDAIEAGADIIMLDNMSPAEVSEALALIGTQAITEASGGISIDTIGAYAKTGVQYLSTSKITLGAGVIDIGLDF